MLVGHRELGEYYVDVCSRIPLSQSGCYDRGMAFFNMSPQIHKLIDLQEKEHLEKSQMLYISLISVSRTSDPLEGSG